MLILLLIASLVFGHLISISDCLLHKQPLFRKSYFEAVQDGVWLAFVMLTSIGFGDIVPKSAFSRLLATIWMFISIGLMAIIYAIMTNNFGIMNLQMTGDLEQIQGPDDLAPYSVGSTLAANSPEFRSRFISSKFRTFATYEDLFSALLNGTIQVVVDRPEIINYYNLLVPATQSLLLPVGPIFNADGTGFGVRRINEYTPHPLLNLLSLAVADVTRTNWQQQQSAFNLWFGDSDNVTEPPLEDLSSDGYQQTLDLLEYVLAGVFGVWVVVSLGEFVRRYPSYKARNDVCAVIRIALGLSPRTGHFRAPARTETALERRAAARRGLAQLARALGSKGSVQGRLDSGVGCATKPPPRASAACALDSEEAPPALADAGFEEAEEDGAGVDVGGLVDYLGAVLAREQAEGRGSAMMSAVLGRCWEYCASKRYAGSRGPALAWEHLGACYREAVGETEGPEGRWTLADAADAALRMLAQEERHWFRSGSLMFPWRGDGGVEEEARKHRMLAVRAEKASARQATLNAAVGATRPVRSASAASAESAATRGAGAGGGAATKEHQVARWGCRTTGTWTGEEASTRTTLNGPSGSVSDGSGDLGEYDEPEANGALGGGGGVSDDSHSRGNGGRAHNGDGATEVSEKAANGGNRPEASHPAPAAAAAGRAMLAGRLKRPVRAAEDEDEEDGEEPGLFLF